MAISSFPIQTNESSTITSTEAMSAIQAVLGGLTGFLVYNDSGTPIVHTGGVDTVLTNDELGAQTLKTFAPNGVTDIWNASSGLFDFSELSNGDMVDIRLNIEVVTSSANQEIEIDMELGIGGFSYLIPFSHDVYKTTGTKIEGGYEGIYMGDDNTRLNGARFVFKSTDDATITVSGWYCKIIKGSNIL